MPLTAAIRSTQTSFDLQLDRRPGCVSFLSVASCHYLVLKHGTDSRRSPVGADVFSGGLLDTPASSSKAGVMCSDAPAEDSVVLIITESSPRPLIP